jgi:hypothetical protein
VQPQHTPAPPRQAAEHARQAVGQHHAGRRRRSAALGAHLDGVPAPLERLGQEREGGFGAAQRTVADRPGWMYGPSVPITIRINPQRWGGAVPLRLQPRLEVGEQGNSPAQSEISSPQPPSFHPLRAT